MPDEVASTNFDFSFNHDVRLHDRFFAGGRLRSDYGKRTYLHIYTHSRRRIDNCCRMNLGAAHLSDFDIRISVLQNACFLEAEVTGIPFRWRDDEDVIE